MAKTRRTTKTPPAPPPPAPSDWLSGWRPLAVLALAVVVFYWTPLTSPDASIQWDAVDTHYSPQKYFAGRLWSGPLPFWTPYIFSGFPFLADPQVGAWYPPNWPFFLAGVTPRAIQGELALHGLLACLGTYLLALGHVDHRAGALLAALAYGLSGFFAGHSSHVGIFSAAAGLPWLLLALDRGWMALGGAIGGCLILAGHFQTALYAFAALTLFAVARRKWTRVPAIAVLAALIACIQVLPGLELTAHSIRAGADYSRSTDGVLPPAGLATLVAPNFLGALSGAYTGPPDITQYYLYGGLLLLPLAALGLRNAQLRLTALLLIVPALWYALGPAAGLYRLIALLPGFRNVRAPVHDWFVVSLGLALLAGAGAAFVLERWRKAYLGPLLILVLFADLLYWNSWNNSLAYARSSYEELYGNKETGVASKVAASQPALSRFHAPDRLSAFGPMNHPLDLKLEATYGYNPLELAAYAAYRDAMSRNPKLLDALNVSRVL
ncbi:MAG: hypothetical protein HY013_09900, partial [Candidatus Solibacter usitatus]|nr:hypothetical protein [Candidatus Solibacter usitatus]